MQNYIWQKDLSQDYSMDKINVETTSSMQEMNEAIRQNRAGTHVNEQPVFQQYLLNGLCQVSRSSRDRR